MLNPTLALPHGCRSVEELLAFHRARFGDTRMMADGEGGQGESGGDNSQEAAQQPPGQPQAPVPSPPPSAPAQQPPGGQNTAERVEDLPTWAQNRIRTLTTEAATANGRSRENARAEAAQQATEQARADVAQEIGRALGLIKDGENEEVDVAKITADLTTAQAAQRDAALELALYKAAGPANADAARLLDSRAFMASVAQVDPADADAVKAAVTKAITDNPNLKATAPAAGASSVEHSGGTGENQSRTPKPLTESLAGHYGTR